VHQFGSLYLPLSPYCVASKEITTTTRTPAESLRNLGKVSNFEQSHDGGTTILPQDHTGLLQRGIRRERRITTFGGRHGSVHANLGTFDSHACLSFRCFLT
jgi:hypothetical protein